MRVGIKDVGNRSAEDCLGSLPTHRLASFSGVPRMRYHDLNVATQILLMGLLAVGMGALVIRAIALIYRSVARVPQRYPRTWTPAQCRLLERFRLAIGLA